MSDYRFRVEFWAILGCVILFAALLEMVRRGKLKERYSLLWFATVTVLGLLTVKRNWLEDLAHVLGIYYPPSALFLVLVFFMLLMLVHFSMVLSKLISDKQELSQKLGLLERRVREIESQNKT